MSKGNSSNDFIGMFLGVAWESRNYANRDYHSNYIRSLLIIFTISLVLLLWHNRFSIIKAIIFHKLISTSKLQQQSSPHHTLVTTIVFSYKHCIFLGELLYFHQTKYLQNHLFLQDTCNGCIHTWEIPEHSHAHHLNQQQSISLHN